MSRMNDMNLNGAFNRNDSISVQNMHGNFGASQNLGLQNQPSNFVPQNQLNSFSQQNQNLNNTGNFQGFQQPFIGNNQPFVNQNQFQDQNLSYPQRNSFVNQGQNDQFQRQGLMNNQNDNFNQNNQKLQQTLQQIAQVTKQNQIQCLCRYMDAYLYEGKMVLKLPQFINILKQKNFFNLTFDQAVEVATRYQIKNAQQKWQFAQEDLVDIQAFENDVFQMLQQDQQEKVRYQQIYDQNKMGYLLMNRMIKFFEDYMMDRGYDVLTLFRQIDRDQSNQLDANELHRALQQIGARDFSVQDCQKLVQLMDKNFDGLIDYYEFAECIGKNTNSKAILDPRHWAYNIFEGLRRKLNSLNQSILQIFNVQNFQRQQVDQPIFVPWNQFLGVLQNLGIQLNRNEIIQLQNMLESNVQKGFVDLNEFQQYLGTSQQKQDDSLFTQYGKIQTENRNRNNFKQDVYFQQKKLVQQIFKKLNEQFVNKNQLDHEFQMLQKQEMQKFNASKSTLVSTQGFINLVEGLCNQRFNNSQQLRSIVQVDQQAFTALLQLLQNQNPQMVDYLQFINMFESYEKIDIILQYLIKQLHQFMEQNNFQTIEQCIQSIGRLPPGQFKLYQQQFKDILASIYLDLSPQEINVIFDQFDTSGAAQQIDLRDLNSYYQQLLQENNEKTQIQKQMLTGFSPNQIQNQPFVNSQFENNNRMPNFSRQYQQALRLYENDFRDMIDAISKMKSGTYQYWRNCIQQGNRNQNIQNKLTYYEFEHGVNLLNLNFNQKAIQTIFIELTDNLNNYLDISEFDELLQYIKNKPFNQRLNEEQILISIIQAINGDDLYLLDVIKQYDKEGISVSTNNFIKIIQKLNSQLSPNEIDSLIKKYVSQDRLNPSNVDCNSFITEFVKLRNQRGIKPGKFDNKVSQQSESDQKLIDGIQRTISKNKQIDKLIEGLKYKDSTGEGYISIKDVEDVFCSLKIEGKPKGLDLGEKQLNNLKSMLKLNNRQQFQIYEFITLIFGQAQADLINQKQGILKQPKNFDAKAVGQADKILNEKELEECRSQIYQLKKQFELKSQEPIKTIFERSKRNPKEENFTGNEFIQIVQAQLGQKVVNELNLIQNIKNIVYYLAEKDANTISYNKLLLAFTRSTKDKPLKQGLTSIQEDYQASIKDDIKKAADENEVQNLITYLIKNSFGIVDIIPDNVKKPCDSILIEQFNQGLKKIKYQPNNVDSLIQNLKKKGDEKLVNLEILKKKYNQAKEKPDMPLNRLQKLSLNVQQVVQKIQGYLDRYDMSNEEFHQQLDIDRDGKVDKREFVTQINNLRIPGVNQIDLSQVFDQLDANQDGSLTVNELSLYLKGAKKQIQDKRKNLDPQILQQHQNEILQLFSIFDENGDGKVDANEIFMTLQSFGLLRTKQECEQLVKKASDGGTALNKKQFVDLMMPIMQDAIDAQSQQTEDLRALFLEADVDFSGFLSVMELYNIFKKLGADVTENDIIEMMTEIDVDRNGQLDIDEFISLMTVGDQINFQSQNSKQTYNLIQNARRISPVDFVKAFKNMPSNFVPSFIYELWKQKKNLPSSVFKIQVDPTTMLWKDIKPLRDIDLKDLNLKEAERPNLRPTETSQGCLITLKTASGIPMPQTGNQTGFSDDLIVKRCVRIAILNKPAKFYEVIYNSIQSTANWNKKDENDWVFNSADQYLYEIIFRTTKKDNLDQGNTKIVFEFVVCVKQDKNTEKLTEMSCGWSEISLDELNRNQTHKLEIKGGTPTAQIEIKKEDLRNNRSGLKMLAKVIGGGADNKLEIETKKYQDLPADIKYHMNLMPSTCLIHKNLLYFTSGFINYKAKKISQQQKLDFGKFTKPSGDPILKSFPIIFDNPDIIEEMTRVWMEDVAPKITDENKKDSNYLIQRSKDYIARLYPILYSEDFIDLNFKGSTVSACGDQKVLDQRKKLVQIALRSGQTFPISTKAKKPTENTSDVTNFTPFSIKELELDIWDTQRIKKDRFIDKYCQQ